MTDLRLDIAVADAKRVDLSERAAELVQIELDLHDRQRLLRLLPLARRRVDGLGHVLEHEVQVELVRLQKKGRTRQIDDATPRCRDERRHDDSDRASSHDDDKKRQHHHDDDNERSDERRAHEEDCLD